ncbi:stringent starvation protein B [Variovorax sp. HW608]|uniref:ClpXP protease specificity-enhancing factor n=1 Tax=Variovorax sp. HW608 TaxID=1034889 RepID=UPI00081FDE14|nr:ClpXP protease specificity-enhancing factor [Variovorax sp. HW608]SCK45018.1 stringent starvation protein B [Variovorax sp. HW608]
MINALESSSTRPYLIRALYEWCTDNGFTPYVAVQVDDSVQVPREYVKNGEIVLNISFDATSSLNLGNEFIEFKARFAGTAREIIVPVSRVIAIYARENGQGMAFPAPVPVQPPEGAPAAAAPVPAPLAAPPRAPLRDATRGAEGDPGRVVHLVTGEGPEETVEAGPLPTHPEDPPRPPAGGGSRPSLKRIK